MSRVLVAALLAFACASSDAAVTTTMIDLPLPGSPRILDIRPDDAIATLIAIPGHDGVFDILGHALPTSVAARCGPIPRNAHAFAANRIAVVLVDR